MTNIPFPPGTKVAGYFRDSGGDEQDLSVDRQIAEFRTWLGENNLIEGKLFLDVAKPGSSTIGRKGLTEMQNHFKSCLADEKGLTVWRFNRLGRNINDSQFIKADLRRRGFIIHSLTDKIPQDHYGQIIEYLLDWKDQEFLETLSEDVASGLKHIVKTFGAMPGTPPRGFIREPVNVGTRRSGQAHILHRWVPDETMTPLVRRAFQMLIEGSSLVNIQTVTGLYGSLNSFVTFFRNPLYKGELHFKDLVIENYCEPVVEPSIWERAQLILRRRAGNRRQVNSELSPEIHPRRVSSSRLLSGIARCARCGSPMNAHSIKEYQYYVCSRSIRRRDCDATRVPAASLENEVLKQIQSLLLNPAALVGSQSRQIEQYQQQVAEFPARRKEISVRLENLHRQISRLADAVAEHGHSAALLDKLTALETQEYELKDELAQIEIIQQAKPEPFNENRLHYIAQQFKALLSIGSPEDQRKILSGWISRLVVDRVDKHSVMVGLDVFIPPKSGPDPPRRNLVLHIEPPWGHQTGPISNHTRSV